jgi:hypothetical protein
MMFTQFDHTVLVRSHGAPTFADKKTKAVWERASAALDTALPIRFTVSGSLGKYNILMNSKSVRQDGNGYSLAYAKGYAMVKSTPATGRVKTGAPGLITLAGKSGLSLDPTVRAWADNHNPLGQLADPSMKVRSLGRVTLNGISCDIIELKSQELKMSIALRHSDALPLRIDSEIRDKKGKLVTSSARVFAYKSIRKPIAEKEFVLH